MARLLIYDAYENKVYTYNSLSENDPMPYSTGRIVCTVFFPAVIQEKTSFFLTCIE